MSFLQDLDFLALLETAEKQCSSGRRSGQEGTPPATNEGFVSAQRNNEKNGGNSSALPPPLTKIQIGSSGSFLVTKDPLPCTNKGNNASPPPLLLPPPLTLLAPPPPLIERDIHSYIKAKFLNDVSGLPIHNDFAHLKDWSFDILSEKQNLDDLVLYDPIPTTRSCHFNTDLCSGTITGYMEVPIVKPLSLQKPMDGSDKNKGISISMISDSLSITRSDNYVQGTLLNPIHTPGGMENTPTAALSTGKHPRKAIQQPASFYSRRNEPFYELEAAFKDATRKKTDVAKEIATAVFFEEFDDQSVFFELEAEILCEMENFLSLDKNYHYLFRSPRPQNEVHAAASILSPSVPTHLPLDKKDNAALLDQALKRSGYQALVDHTASKEGFATTTSKIDPSSSNSTNTNKTSAVSANLLAELRREVGISKDHSAISTPNNKKWARIVNVNMRVDDFHQLVPNMAKKYSFELDTFQKQAVIQMESNNSLFVAAHTSAGKTVIAEYAIALSANHMTKCIYTSPIKALSNQKFRDFKKVFDDVGLMTGDVQINTKAQCLIMTTEILRSMLYKGADILRDVEWLIFDEIHYINDADRGVVWEEVIIMLPDHVNVAFLSATVPNTEDFAEWIGETKKRPIYVISTLYRPVPLVNYLYTGIPTVENASSQKSKSTTDEDPFSRYFHKILGAKKEFYQTAQMKATQELNRRLTLKPNVSSEASSRSNRPGDVSASGPQHGPTRPAEKKGNNGSRGGGPSAQNNLKRIEKSYNVQKNHSSHNDDNSDGSKKSSNSIWINLLTILKKKDTLPLIAFTLSRSRCDSNAKQMSSLDLTTPLEKKKIEQFIRRAITILKKEDRALPQIARVSSLLLRGIGVHHSGLLPIVKEIVEILFGKGYVKVLFATETFAMGVNMPARSVAFDSLSKFDGESDRLLLPGEYTQMAGRAGRRGLDKTGTVIILCQGKVPTLADLKTTLTGQPTKLESRFRLTYNMILNILRTEEFKVEDIIRKSFSEHATGAKGTDELLALEESYKTKQDIEVSCTTCETMLQASNAEIDADHEDDEKSPKQLFSEAYTAFYQNCADFYQYNLDIVKELSENNKTIFQPGRVVIINTPTYRNTPACIYKVSQQVGTMNLGVIIEVSRALLNAVHETPLMLPVYNAPHSVDFFPKILSVPISEVFYVTSVVLQASTNLAESGSKASANSGPNTKRPARPGPTSILLNPKSTYAQSLSGKTDTEVCRLFTSAFSSYLSSIQGTNVLVRARPVEDLRVSSYTVTSLYEKLQDVHHAIVDFSCLKCPNIAAHYNHFHQLAQLQRKVAQMQTLFSNENLKFTPEYKSRLKVLQARSFIDSNNTVLLKGKVSCELVTLDEMLTTELLLQGVFTPLTPEECVAVLSCMAFQGKSPPPKLNQSLIQATAKVTELARDIALSQQSAGLTEITVEKYLSTLNFGLVEVIYEWARGMPFLQITGLTSVDEGTIVRTIVRLDKACQDICNACRIIGDPAMHRKIMDASEMIRRDIVFAGSLYIQ